MQSHDAVLLVAFGGPTSMEEVRPFLARAVRDRPIPQARIEQVVRHYERIGGCSPLNKWTFRQASALRDALRDAGRPLPVYVGMCNWHPFLAATLTEMAAAGIRRAAGLILAPQQSDASWDRYQRDVATARKEAGGPTPIVDLVPGWHAHSLFIETMSERTAAALATLHRDRQERTTVIFTAHSIPVPMAEQSPYVSQFKEQGQAIADRVNPRSYRLAYQSRTGNPRDPWLEPDISDAIREEAAKGTTTVVVVPIGFVCDHVEVLYDLDVEARATAESLGLHFVRAATANDHPAFIRMMTDVIRTHVARA